MADDVATWSKDPSRKIGAVIVKDRRILSTGYNGFPRGVNDTEDRYLDRDVKYKMVCHAEENAIYNAALEGISLKGSTMYVSGLPVCNNCARGIIQTGITSVIMRAPVASSVPTNWEESFEFTKIMFDDAGIDWRYMSGESEPTQQLLLG